MQEADLLSLAQGQNPSPTLIVEEPGLGFAALALLAAKSWSQEPVRDYSQMKIVMSQSGEGLQLKELLHSLSLKATAPRAVIINLTGASLEVQNALLKTLEEPPFETWIIMMAASGYGLLATVKSRCTVLQASPLSDLELSAWAEDKGIAASPQMISMAAGNPGRLTWLSENPEAEQALKSGKASQALSLMNQQEKPADWLDKFLSCLGGSASIEPRRLLASGVRPELVLASLFLV
jgi:DNA polymerase III delta prime subunit